MQYQLKTLTYPKIKNFEQTYMVSLLYISHADEASNSIILIYGSPMYFRQTINIKII